MHSSLYLVRGFFFFFSLHFLSFLTGSSQTFLIADPLALDSVFIAFHPVISKEIKCLKGEVPSPKSLSQTVQAFIGSHLTSSTVVINT